MKVIINNSVVDLDLVYKIDSERVNLSRHGCPMFRNQLNIRFLNDKDFTITQPNDIDDEAWNKYVEVIISFWADNKKENIKTFNL
jgi:hypothetical protein